MNFSQKLLAVLRFAGIMALVMGLLWLLELVLSPAQARENADFYFLETIDDADCSVLVSGGKCVIIDCGEAQDFETLNALLEKLGISRIDCLILTHPDKDHIGSAQALAQNYSLGLVVQPYYDKEKSTYDELNAFLDEQKIPRLIPARARQLMYGSLRITVFPPDKSNYNNDNNYSLALSVKHGDVSLFFAGDAYIARTREIMNLPLSPVNIYHASYHGRDYEGSTALIEKLSPEIAIITSDAAGTQTQARLDFLGIQTEFTRRASVHFSSDGVSLTKSALP